MSTEEQVQAGVELQRLRHQFIRERSRLGSHWAWVSVCLGARRGGRSWSKARLVAQFVRENVERVEKDAWWLHESLFEGVTTAERKAGV